jgi:hypothetical protein
VWFGRGEYENHVLGRLFQRFQQGVECLLRQHMDLIDDINLVSPSNRGEAHIVPELSHLVDAVITRAVNLKNVEADT